MNHPNLLIEATYNTPFIEFDGNSGTLDLIGKSIPENASKLYEPVIAWLKKYITNPSEETNLHLNLDYFNTSSSIWIARIVKLLSQINDKEKLLIVHLYFHIEEFEDMEEEDLKEAIAPATDVLSDAKVSIGVKIYGKSDSGTILKEKLVLF
jgi:hypothetical protein